MTYNPGFYSVNSLGEKSLLTNLENNMKAFLSWGFLNIGGYVNVQTPQSNISAFNQHLLRPTKDQNRGIYTTWQSPRKDWVHETGVCYSNTEPLEFSGVTVNSVFYPAPTGSGAVTYKVDYPNGQITFNTKVAPTSVVSANYAYKSIQVYKSNDFPSWKEIQFDSSLNLASQFQKYDKGDWSIPAEHRVQLPAVVIETTSRSDARPFRLGDRSLVITQDLLLHVISDNKEDCNKVVDILRLQEDRFIWLFDTNKVIEDKVYELNFDGSLNVNGKNYYNLVNNPTYQWKLCRFSDINISEIKFYHINLFGSTVRVTNEIIYEDFDANCGSGGGPPPVGISSSSSISYTVSVSTDFSSETSLTSNISSEVSESLSSSKSSSQSISESTSFSSSRSATFTESGSSTSSGESSQSESESQTFSESTSQGSSSSESQSEFQSQSGSQSQSQSQSSISASSQSHSSMSASLASSISDIGSSDSSSGSSGSTGISSQAGSSSESADCCGLWVDVVSNMGCVPVTMIVNTALEGWKLCGTACIPITLSGNCASGSGSVCGAGVTLDRCCTEGCGDYTDCDCYPDNSDFACITGGTKVRSGCSCGNGGGFIELGDAGECTCCGCAADTCIKSIDGAIIDSFNVAGCQCPDPGPTCTCSCQTGSCAGLSGPALALCQDCIACGQAADGLDYPASQVACDACDCTFANWIQNCTTCCATMETWNCTYALMDAPGDPLCPGPSCPQIEVCSCAKAYETKVPCSDCKNEQFGECGGFTICQGCDPLTSTC